jgi:hypothetical protein
MYFLKKVGQLFFAAAGLALFSCETIVEVPIPEHEPKLALRYMLGNDKPDSAFYMHFPNYQAFASSSQSILETAYLEGLNNASLVVTDANGTVVETFQNGVSGPGVIGNGYYNPVSKFAGTPGQRYTFTASAPGFKTVTASLTLPGQVSGLQASFTPSSQSQFGLDGKVTVTLPDNGSENNYYQIYGLLLDDRKVANARDYFRENTDEENAGVGAEFEEIHFSEAGSYYYQLPFNDMNFNGRTITFTREVNMYIGNASTPPRYLRVILHSITRDTYRFLKSYRSYEDNYGNPFAEPTRVVGNLENGYGFFGGYTSTYVDIPL